mgnify:CR=1 FL=1
MLYWIVFIVIVIACVAMVSSMADSWYEYIVLPIAGLLLGCVLGSVVALGTGGLIEAISTKEYVKTQEESLLAINDTSSTEGRFFLGSGYVEGKMKYIYIVSMNEEMQMKSAFIDNVKLVYSDDLKVETYSAEFKSKFIKFLLREPNFSDDQYKIYIPEGTIKQDYIIDLQ